MLSSRPRTIAVIGGLTTVVFAISFAIGAGETPAALTLLGALLVAALAAWTAEHRLARQLAAASERHERELAAAQAQLVRQLEHDREQREADRRHDREMIDLADLRRMADDALDNGPASKVLLSVQGPGRSQHRRAAL